MKIKDKITQSLASITVELQEISPDFYVIGASAMILSGIEVGETADIDILTTEMNSCKLQHLLKTYMEISPETKEDDLFRSNFARFKLPLMDIEVMGDLQIKKNDIWQSVCVKEYKEIFIGNLIIKIPIKSAKRKNRFSKTKLKSQIGKTPKRKRPVSRHTHKNGTAFERLSNGIQTLFFYAKKDSKKHCQFSKNSYLYIVLERVLPLQFFAIS